MREELEYLYGLERLGIQPGLEVMQRLMNALGNPEKQFKSIHITGTNGKGSTCAMLESILRHAGCKTALYTSPHLYAFNERIRVAGVAISDQDLITLIHEIREVITMHSIQTTFFEFTTALAFLYFARSGIDVAVVEVGMGGRLDATNVITPLLSIITNIGLDHMEFLGDTTEKIAYEKAGIIKPGIAVVTREEDDNILRVFDEAAKNNNTHVVRVSDVVKTRILGSNLSGQDVDITMSNQVSYTIHLPLLGAHQVKNAETVLAAISVLEDKGIFNIDREAIITGIAQVQWEGRLQVASQRPLIIVDGAHNSDGAKVLADFLQDLPVCDVLVFAAKKGKNVHEVLELLLPYCKRVIITKGSYIPEDPEVIAEMVGSMYRSAEIRDDVDEAMKLGMSYIGERGVMLVAGSLYMIPDALAFLKQSGV